MRTPPPRTSLHDPRPSEWGPWEWRNHLVDHPMAVPGLRKACLNAVYSVQFFQHETDWGIVDHLMIRRHDEQPVRSWADVYRIKNELVGLERVGIEIYPADSTLIDDANIYHLWVLPKGMVVPFGLHTDTYMR